IDLICVDDVPTARERVEIAALCEQRWIQVELEVRIDRLVQLGERRGCLAELHQQSELGTVVVERGVQHADSQVRIGVVAVGKYVETPLEEARAALILVDAYRDTRLVAILNVFVPDHAQESESVDVLDLLIERLRIERLTERDVQSLEDHLIVEAR